MNLYKQACKLWRYNDYTARRVTQQLRAKWIKAVQRMGQKWLMHPDNFVTRK
jgi:hypothetical protein